MSIYSDAEKELAELLGWRQVSMYLGTRTQPTVQMSGLYKDSLQRRIIPMWCDDSDACFSLMIKYDAYPYLLIDCTDEIGAYVDIDCQSRTFIAEHPDKAMAVRYAIVQAVILKLKKDSK